MEPSNRWVDDDDESEPWTWKDFMALGVIAIAAAFLSYNLWVAFIHHIVRH